MRLLKLCTKICQRLNYFAETTEKVGAHGVIKLKHNFKESLAFSHEFEDHPIWSVIYAKAFPSMLDMVTYRSDGFWQREGVDRGIFLSNTKQILIDEKVRGRNKITGIVYEDIALEVWSNKEKKTPGWLTKQLRADYIAYLIAPLGICHLLPVIQLQSAFDKHKEAWLSKFQVINSKNFGYTTESVCIPPNILYPAIGSELRINFDPFEVDQ
jgi:hypothetical protein